MYPQIINVVASIYPLTTYSNLVFFVLNEIKHAIIPPIMPVIMSVLRLVVKNNSEIMKPEKKMRTKIDGTPHFISVLIDF